MYYSIIYVEEKEVLQEVYVWYKNTQRYYS